MSLPAYDIYKDSGIDWLKKLPTHWSAVPIKHVGRLKGGAGFPHEEQGRENEELCFHKVNALSKTDSDGYLTDGENTISRDTAKKLGAFIFPPNTIVFAKVGAALLLGRIRLLNTEACIDNNMMGVVVREDSFDPSFVRYGMSLVQFDLIANPGAVPSLNEGQIGNFRMATPPLDEQKAISSFLDRETAKIDALVTEQRRLIVLLKDKRQAVINHAVIKGLDPTVPLKDSGIEWLGEVPEHWEKTRLDRVSDFVNGKAHEPFVSEEGRFICVNSRFISTNGEAVKMCSENLAPAEHGDVLMVMSDLPNGRALARTFHVQDDRCYAINQRVCAIRSRTSSSRFLFHLLDRNPWFLQNDDGLNQTHLSNAAFRKMYLFLPPLEEQKMIASHLDQLMETCVDLSRQAERAIALLQERRRALISAAVTGKIDVREHAMQETA